MLWDVVAGTLTWLLCTCLALGSFGRLGGRPLGPPALALAGKVALLVSDKAFPHTLRKC